MPISSYFTNLEILEVVTVFNSIEAFPIEHSSSFLAVKKPKIKLALVGGGVILITYTELEVCESTEHSLYSLAWIVFLKIKLA